MKKTTKLSAAALVAIAIITPTIAYFEGKRNKPYKDIVGVVTVCYGHTKNVQKRRYSDAECEELLTDEIKEFARKVEQCQPNLPISVKAAFISASYNIGTRIACNTRTSTAARFLKAGLYKEACNQLPRWNRAGGKAVRGLTIRRKAEQKLCLEGLNETD